MTDGSSALKPGPTFGAWQEKTAAEQHPVEEKLAPAQQRLWLMEQLAPEQGRNNCPHAFVVEGDFPLAGLESAINVIARSHDEMQLGIETNDVGQPQKSIADLAIQTIPLVDLSILGLDPDKASEVAMRLARQAAARPFDLTKAPLWRVGCIRQTSDRHLFYFIAHHIILDDWSMRILVEQLTKALGPLRKGQPQSLTRDVVKPYKPGDPEETAHAMDFWRKHLADLPMLSLPTDRPRSRGATRRAEKVFRSFDSNLVGALEDTARDHRLTVFSACLAALRLILARFSSQGDFAIGIPVLNRFGEASERRIGLLTELVALRRELGADANTVWEAAALEQELVLQCLAHTAVPFNEVVRAVGGNDRGTDDALFNVMFAYHEQREAQISLEDATFLPVDIALPYTPFELSVMAVRIEGGLSISLEYDRSLFDRWRIDAMLDEFVAQLEIAAGQRADPAIIVQGSEVRLVGPPSREQSFSLSGEFRRRCDERPDAVALHTDCGSYSFGWLSRRASQFAAGLAARGLGPENRIILCMARGADHVAAIWGTILAGAAFANVDVELPEERRSTLLRSLAPDLLVTDGVCADTPVAAERTILFSSLVATGEESGGLPSTERHPDGLAYLVTTSGSTGTPKVVAVPNKALENRLAWMAELRPWSPTDVALSRSNPLFVDFICEALAPTLGGAPLVIPGESELDPTGLCQAILQHRTTRLVATPSLLRAMSASMESIGALASLRLLVSSGETLDTTDLAPIQTLAPRAELWNIYGSSEMAADATAELVESDAKVVTLGRPIAGMEAIVLDRWSDQVSHGAVGELTIAGTGLARGYLANPSATAAVFRPLASGDSGRRGFASGDLAEITQDGLLRFHGRELNRANIRGVRVELGDVETLLRSDHDVGEAYAAVITDSAGRDCELIAVVEDWQGKLDLAALRNRLLDRVPAYLVPDRLAIGLAPRTPSGKVDRNRIADLLPAAEAGGPLLGKWEELVGQVWAEVLDRPISDRAAHFFAEGGHSLAAARVAAILSKHAGKKIPIGAILRNPVLHRQAQEVAQVVSVERAEPHVAASLPQPDSKSRYDPFPLTALQEAYLAGRGDDFGDGGVGLHGYSEIELQSFGLDEFEQALNRLVVRHDMLRAVVLEDGQQQVLESVPHYTITRLEPASKRPEDLEQLRQEIRSDLAQQRLDLGRWPCFDIRASGFDKSDLRLHVSFDALFVDAWSQNILLRELMALIAGESLPPIPETSFREYCLWLRARQESNEYKRQFKAWEKRLLELPHSPVLPGKDVGGVEQPLSISQLNAHVSTEVIASLSAKSTDQGDLNSVLLAAFAQILSRWTENKRFLLNVPTSGRSTQVDDVDSIVGPFGDFTYASFDFDRSESFADVVESTREQLDWALEHAQVSGMAVQRALSAARGFGSNASIVFTSLNFNRTAQPSSAATGFEQKHSASQTPQVLLDNRVRLQADGSLAITWDVARERLEDGLPDLLLRAYCDLLEALADRDWSEPAVNPEIPSLDPVSPRAAPKRLDDEFWQNVESQPNAPAIIFKDGAWSYRELARQATRIASDLANAGVKRGDRVAMAVPKGPEQIAATLAITRCGAVFAPLDPSHPDQRLRDLIEQLQPAAMVVSLADQHAHWVGAHATAIADVQASPTSVPMPPNPAEPDDLAYIIHTSGSTGRPKGVMISHSSAWNTICAVNDRLELGPDDRILALSMPGFDLSIWDIFGTLSAGAAIVTTRSTEKRDPGAWLSLAEAAKATIWNSAPGLMSLALDRNAPGIETLRWALLSGDFIPLTMPEDIRSLAPTCRVLAMGGATEGSIWSVWREVEHVDPSWRSIPYGRAMPGQGIGIVDGDLIPRPKLAEGEIVLFGHGLAQGYWRNTDETDRRFVIEPSSNVRIYRTGDRGRLRNDGEIEILGRIDRQFKIAGNRIEPGEIEAAARTCPGVRECLVTKQSTPGSSDQLVAHVLRDADPKHELPSETASAERSAGIEKLALRMKSDGARELPNGPRFSLDVLPADMREDVFARRSRRIFLPRVLQRRQLGALLGALAELPQPPLPFAKRQYGSAGNLYPVNTYLALRKGAVSGLEGGWYHLDQSSLELVELSGFDKAADKQLFPGVNQLLWDSSSFAIILVGEMTTIEQVYGSEAQRFAVLEAGEISQLLEMQAESCGLGLCQVGAMDIERVREACQLPEEAQVIHGLVGGPVHSDDVQGMTEDAYAWHEPAKETARWLADRQCEADLRTHLARRLPEALRPTEYHFWEQFPQTANGKVDLATMAAHRPRSDQNLEQIPKKALSPKLQKSTDGRETGAAEHPDRASVGQELTDLWRQLLDLDDVGPRDNFLKLGGTSLQAIRLMTLVETRFGISPKVEAFLHDPTIDWLTSEVCAQGVDVADARLKQSRTRIPEGEPFALTPMQQAYVAARSGAIDHRARSARSYFEVDVSGLDLARLERAMRQLIARHGMLRVRFEPPDFQRIEPDIGDWQLETVDLSDASNGQLADQLSRMREEIVTRDCDLQTGPFVELVAAILPAQTVRLFFALDLIACDARSFQILYADLMEFYENDGSGLAPLQYGFADCVALIESERKTARGERDRAYWMQRLADLPPPPSLPQVPHAASQKTEFRRLTSTLDGERLAKLKDIASNVGATASGAICAAFARVLSIWAGRDPFTLTLTTFGRDVAVPDVEQIVGDFTASAIVEIRPDVPSFADLATATQRQILTDLQHGRFSGVEVIRELNRKNARVGGWQPTVVFTSLIDMPPPGSLTAEGVSSSLVHAASQTPQVLLDHQVFSVEDDILFNWDFPDGVFPPGLIEQMFRTYCDYLHSLCDNTDVWNEAT